jgi:hypothetical protein
MDVPGWQALLAVVSAVISDTIHLCADGEAGTALPSSKLGCKRDRHQLYGCSCLE